MFAGWAAALLALAVSTGWGENAFHAGAFIFIEEQPPFTSEDRTAKSVAFYLEDGGLVQRYACEDYLIEELKEASLPVAGVFRALNGIPSESLPAKQESAEAMLPPSQAHPGHLRVIARQSGGARLSWAGQPDAVPSRLAALIRRAKALAARAKRVPPASGAFLRADALDADNLAEYRAGNSLKTLKNVEEMDPALRETLAHPFRLIPVSAGANPFSAFAMKGEPDRLRLLYKETSYEVIRYSWARPSRPATP
ncbi:MAG: hypothetical protein ABII00_11365 [Elusimicrobiota bacterium]